MADSVSRVYGGKKAFVGPLVTGGSMTKAGIRKRKMLIRTLRTLRNNVFKCCVKLVYTILHAEFKNCSFPNKISIYDFSIDNQVGKTLKKKVFNTSLLSL